MLKFKVASAPSVTFTVKVVYVGNKYTEALVPDNLVRVGSWLLRGESDITATVHGDKVTLEKAFAFLYLSGHDLEQPWAEAYESYSSLGVPEQRLEVLRNVYSCGYTLLKEAEAIFQSQGKIEAIKFLRKNTGMGLRVAKDVVEALF